MFAWGPSSSSSSSSARVATRSAESGKLELEVEVCSIGNIHKRERESLDPKKERQSLVSCQRLG